MGFDSRRELKTARVRRLFLVIAGAVFSSFVTAGSKYRVVILDTICHAPIQAMEQSAHRFCREFQACPDSLFEWAYLGLEEEKTEKEKTKESRDAIQLRYKDRNYDPKTLTGDVAIDIYVLGVRWWKDTHLGTHCKHVCSKTLPQTSTSHMTATYSGSLLEGGNCIFELKALSPTTTQVHFTFDFTFGQMLALFISDKVWHNAIEWRFKVILENLVEYAETGDVKRKKK